MQNWSCKIKFPGEVKISKKFSREHSYWYFHSQIFPESFPKFTELLLAASGILMQVQEHVYLLVTVETHETF